MTDLTLLANPPVLGEFSGSQTSTDPKSQYDPETDTYIEWGANEDYKGFRYIEGDAYVVFDSEGPGVIWRIWAGSFLIGRIKIYIDDMENPAVDLDYKEYMDRYFYTAQYGNCPNLTPTLSRGRQRLIPIPFNKRCKITLTGIPEWGTYYQFTYSKYPKDYQLPVYNDQIDLSLCIGLTDTERKLQNRGEYPYKDEDSKQKTVYKNTIKPGETANLFTDKTSGAVTSVIFDLSPYKTADFEKILKGLFLNAYWDNETTPGISAPLGAFFGCNLGYRPFRTYAVGMHARKCYCYFYMPYKEARFTLTNNSTEEITVSFEFLSEPLPEETANNSMRFCVKYNDTGYWDGLDNARFAKGGDRWPDWPLLRIHGAGRFCGFALFVDNSWPYDFPDVKWDAGELVHWPEVDTHWWGEGDEKFFVDGEKYPSTFGTGAEDYFGFSFAANPPFVTFDSAFAAQSEVPARDNNGLTSLIRCQIADNVPFQKSFEAYLEKYNPDQWEHNGVKGKCSFASVSYWYIKK